LFALAERLGATVAELGRRMDSAEMTEWMAFDELRAEERERARLAAEAERKAKGIVRGHGRPRRR